MAAPEVKPIRVSEIKGRLMRPALTSHFICEFKPPESLNSFVVDRAVEGGFLGADYANRDNQELIRLSCANASLPGSSLATHEINNDHTGVTERHVYRRQYDQRTEFTFYVDSEYRVIDFFENWMSYIVSEDENENELRMILNFGHTVGHAIESFTNYKNLLHGEAIFYGMKCALYLSNKFGNLSNDEYDISTQLLSKFELPKLDIDDRETFINFVKNDKKFREEKIRFILLDEIGKSRISEDITFDQIKESLSVL